MRARNRRNRRGLTSVAVLVLLFVIGLMAASLVRLSFSYRQRSRADERAMQSDLLADAGLDRAFARLSADPAYKGERWEIPAEALGAAAATDGGPAAVVTIEVIPGEGRRRTVRVQADYPPEAPLRVRSSREAALPDEPK